MRGMHMNIQLKHFLVYHISDQKAIRIHINKHNKKSI